VFIEVSRKEYAVCFDPSKKFNPPAGQIEAAPVGAAST